MRTGGGWGGDHGGIKMEWNRGVNCVKMGGGRMYIVHCVHYIGEKDCIQLGSLQGLYKRFPIRNLSR